MQESPTQRQTLSGLYASQFQPWDGFDLHPGATIDDDRYPISLHWCPAGQVRLSWLVDGGERLHFEWAETGGPPVSEPTRKSFGTRMMTSLGQQLKGKILLDYRPSGFVYALDVPLEALMTKPKERTLEASA